MPSVILTRTESENARVSDALTGLGYELWSVPMIELRPIVHAPARLAQCAALARGAPVLITSAHAARMWLELRQGPFADDAPSSYLVVGNRSATLLAELDPTVPITAVATSAAALSGMLPTGISDLLYPCSAARRDEGVEWLRAHGVRVHELPLYEPMIPQVAEARMREALERSTLPRAIVFFSPSAVANWFSLRSDIPADSIFVAIGPTTAESLRAHRVEEVVTAGGTDTSALAATLVMSLGRGA